MKERPITFKCNDDPTLVVDDNGELAKKLKKIYNDLNFNLSFCYEQLTKGKLTEGMKETHLYLAEHYMIDFLSEVNYDSILSKKKEEIHKEIRNLNEENRELRRQLGDKVTNEDAREKMKNISDSFKKWWNIDGFGHTSDIHFTCYGGVEVNLSGRITNSYYSEKRIKAKDKAEIIKQYGFTISDDDGYEILVTDNNTELLNKFLKSKYPSAEIIEFNTVFWSGKNRYRDIKVLIRNLDDFLN